MEAVECGAAALGMILGYYGRYVALEEMRVACGVSRDGSKASNIIEAAQKYGLIAKGYRAEAKDLPQYPMPCILFWNGNHFVVLEGFKKDRAFLNDPTIGKKWVTKEELEQSFTEYVLTFEPGEDFTKGGERPSLLRALLRRLPGYQEPLAYIVLAGLVLVGPGLVVPTFSRIFVDQFLVHNLRYWMEPLLIGMGITALFRGTLIWLQRRYLTRMEAKLALTNSSRFFWHVLCLPMDFYHQRYGGEIGSRVALNDRVAERLSGDLPTTLLNLILLLFYAALMLAYDPWLMAIGVVTGLLNLFGLRFATQRRADAYQRVQQEKGKLMGATMSGLQVIETIKATSSETDFFARWAGFQAKMVNAEQQAELAAQLLAVLPYFLSALNTLAVLGLGGFYVINGKMSMGALVAFQSLMVSFLAPINQLVEQVDDLQELQNDLNRLDDVFRHPPDPQVDRLLPSNVALDPAVKLLGLLELRDISFGYSRLGDPLIKNFNLTVQPGRRVALVGSSGSGKSTIAKLVGGLYEPWQGEILIDGRPRSELHRRTINNSLAMVDQDIFLFEDTVRENLTLWDPTVPDLNIIQAAKDAAIHEDIMAKPGGYDYLVQENGRNFSGGQKQRIEIARALVGNPTILVLDEATSALDPHTEQVIDDNLRKRGCTCLIIAHRLSTIRDCDEIIVLDRGEIVQRGSHEELIRQRQGFYAKLIQADTVE